MNGVTGTDPVKVCDQHVYSHLVANVTSKPWPQKATSTATTGVTLPAVACQFQADKSRATRAAAKPFFEDANL